MFKPFSCVSMFQSLYNIIKSNPERLIFVVLRSLTHMFDGVELRLDNYLECSVYTQRVTNCMDLWLQESCCLDK